MAGGSEIQLQQMTPEETKLTQAYTLTDNVLMKKYLLDLNNYDVVTINKDLAEQEINDIARFYHLDRIIYDKEENNQEKLLNVYNALYTCGGSVVLLLKSDSKKVDFYIGTKPNAENQLRTCQEVLEKAIRGNFKGTQVTRIVGDDNVNTLVKNIFPEDAKAIAAITSVASFREGHTMKSGDFVQGLEKLLETTQGEEFSLMILAQPITPAEIEIIRNGYENLYSQLLPFAETEINYGQIASKAVSDSITNGLSEGITESVAYTKTHSHSKGTSTSKSHTVGKSSGHTIGVGIGGSGSSSVSNSTTGSLGVEASGKFLGVGASATASIAKTIGSAISTALSLNANYSYNWSKNESDTITNGSSETDTDSEGRTDSQGKQKTESTSTTKSNTISAGQSINYTTHMQNRGVKTLLEHIDVQLKRLDECADLGMWDSAAYVIAEDAQTSRVVASSYQALIRGKNSGVENSAVTVWNANAENQKFKTRAVANYLKKMEHPLLKEYEDSPIIVTPAAMISGEELTVAAGLPQQSLPGLPVDNIAKFGREVIYQRNFPNKTISFGKIYHMGQIEEKSEVRLNIDLLTSHAFVTGSTGAGKSNAVYKLLQELKYKKIPWLVIEPAKGEYKDAFGGMNNVDVYGTNPYKVPNLLQINPFSFPDDIHVLEHIDRLVEIFNACWPMYAAMPAILRESIERAYESCGWSLKFSKNPGQFPTFDTLLDILPKVVDSSAYSSDTSSDYKGALVTRVRSLTRGIHGMIFSGDVDFEKLLNTPSIIDLSRVGSQETKSLIMGVLVLKLQEFRMSEDISANSELRHITVLEEAHNLLRRTSSEQSQEGSNLQGQSVAMIANAIAEMRTYGEGFVIADQSPALMDMSVIRNTNTKIILRLPDESDRQLVGKATGLSDVQIEELSGLDLGVAAIFQSDWTEPVLCKIDRFTNEKSFKDRYKGQVFTWHDSESLAVKKFLNKALDIEKVELSKDEIREVRKWYNKLHLSEKAMYIFENVIENKNLIDTHKIILLNYALEQVINNNPRRNEAVEAAKNMLIANFDVDKNDELVQSVTNLFLKNLPERFAVESTAKHVK